VPHGEILNHLICTRRSWCSCGFRRRSSGVRFLGSHVRIPLGEWMFVSCVCYVSCR